MEGFNFKSNPSKIIPKKPLFAQLLDKNILFTCHKELDPTENHILKIRVNDLTLDESTHSDSTIDILDNGQKILFTEAGENQFLISYISRNEKRVISEVLISEDFKEIKVYSEELLDELCYANSLCMHKTNNSFVLGLRRGIYSFEWDYDNHKIKNIKKDFDMSNRPDSMKDSRFINIISLPSINGKLYLGVLTDVQIIIFENRTIIGISTSDRSKEMCVIDDYILLYNNSYALYSYKWNGNNSVISKSEDQSSSLTVINTKRIVCGCVNQVVPLDNLSFLVCRERFARLWQITTNHFGIKIFTSLFDMNLYSHTNALRHKRIWGFSFNRIITSSNKDDKLFISKLTFPKKQESFETNSLQNNSQHILKEIYQKMEFYDLEITVKDKTFKAHRNILSANSLILQNHFSAIWKLEKDSNIYRVILEDINPEAFSVFLQYLYTKEIEWDKYENIASHLLDLSHRFCIDNLKKECELKMKSEINFSNACLLYSYSKQFDIDKLEKECLIFIKRNFDDIKETSEYNEFKIENPQMLLSLYESMNSKKRKINET
tara:strand:- start:3182 stop:4828 length:1647 start_codon:yes stop_codon:yes gene_type:complete